MWSSAQSSRDRAAEETTHQTHVQESLVANNVENPGTYLPRLQILRLEQRWPNLPESQRERVMAAVIGQLPEPDLRGHAAMIAAIYAQIHQFEAPHQLVELRISLRASQEQAIDETAEVETQQINSSAEEEHAQEELQDEDSKS